MVTFRKSLLLLAIVATMAAVASAQVVPPMSCTANAGSPPIVRSEGLAELVGDVVLQCTGGIPTLRGNEVPKVNFRIFMNATVTSRLSNNHNWNEALLMIDEPAEGDQRLCTSHDGCTIYGEGGEPGVDYTFEYNVWQGQPVTNNVGPGIMPNTIDWLGVPVDPPGTRDVRIVRITNVRVNAAEKGLGGLIPTQLTMYISTFGPTGLPITNPTVQVGFIQRGMVFSSNGGLELLQCEPGRDRDDEVTVTFSEMFSSAFKVRNDATSVGCPTCYDNQAVPGGIYNTESGFHNWMLNDDNEADEAGLADQGTQLMAVFANIPDGVSISVAEANSGSSSDNTGALVVSGDPISNPSSGDFVELTVVNGVAMAVWEVTGANPSSNDSMNFRVRVDFDDDLPELGEATVAGTYAPLSTVLGADDSGTPVPRFVDTEEDPEPLFAVVTCATNLLWPYVTNQAGFDTGMVISNTTMDPFSTPGQSGTCTINYYGNEDGAAPPASQTTPEIGPGGYAIWSLYNGGGVKNYGEELGGMTILETAGFEGYVIAECEFQMAHGYAFISDLGASRVAQGYVALVLDGDMFNRRNAGRSRTGVRSERLNQ